MAKVSSINKNKKRQKLTTKFCAKRLALHERIYNKKISLEDRFALVMSLAALPRNGARIRVRNRCELTGRSRGYIRKFGLSRNMVRDFAGKGLLPGVIKASW